MIILEAEYEGVQGIGKSQFNKIMRDSLRVMGLHWRKKFLPMHFGNKATSRYGYAKRAGESGNTRRKFSRSYTGRKLKKYGHTRPLELTGASKAEALSSDRVDTKYRGGEGAALIPLPQGFNRRAAGSRVRMNEEIRAVREDELKELGDLLTAEIAKGIEKLGGSGSAGATLYRE